MASCDLRIVLDRPDRRFAAGEKVTGAVKVRVEAGCECGGLTLGRFWQTHGKGNRATGTAPEPITLYKGPWTPGEGYSYKFSFDAPDGPVSYHGHYLNVDWFLEARADIPWAIDPKAREEFLVVPGKDTSRADLGPNYKPPPERERAAKSAWGVGCGVLFGLCFAGPGAGIFLLSDSTLGRAFGAVFILVGAGIVFAALRNRLAQWELGTVVAKLEPRELRAGGVANFTLDFTPRSDVRIGKVTAALVGRESVVQGGGTDSTTYAHELHKDERLLASERSLAPGERAHFACRFTLPATAPSTFEAPDNELTWSVKAEIDVTGWPDWVEMLGLCVRP